MLPIGVTDLEPSSDKDPSLTETAKSMLPTGFWIFFLSLFGVVIISHVPGILLLATLFLILPGLTLLISNTVFLYVLLCIPAAIVWNRTHTLSFLLLIPVVFAFGVPILSQRYLAHELNAYIAPDFETPTVLVPKIIAIEGQMPLPYGGAGCGPLCQSLLYGGSVEKVLVRPFLDEKRWESWSIRHDGPGQCASVTRPLGTESANEKENDIITARLAMGDCLVKTGPETEIVPDLTIVYANLVDRYRDISYQKEWRDLVDHNAWWVMDTVENFQFVEKSYASTTITLDKTWAKGQALKMPFVFTAGLCLDMCHEGEDNKIRVWRQTYDTGAMFPLYESLARRYHIETEPTDLTAAAKQSEFSQILEIAQKDILTTEQVAVLDRTLLPIAKKSELSPDDIALFRKVIRLPGVTNSDGVTWLVITSSKNRLKRNIFAEDALARLQMTGMVIPRNGGRINRSLFLYLSRTDAAFLKAHAVEIEKLLLNPENAHNAVNFIAAVPSLGLNTESIFVQLLDSPLWDMRIAAVGGLCKLDVPDPAVLAPKLISLINSAGTRTPTHNVDPDISFDGYNALARTLTRLGYKDAALEAVRQKDWPDAYEAAEKTVSGLDTGFDPQKCSSFH